KSCGSVKSPTTVSPQVVPQKQVPELLDGDRNMIRFLRRNRITYRRRANIYRVTLHPHSPGARSDSVAMSLKPTHGKCVVRGCRASNKSLHRLPKEQNIAEKWIEFVFGDPHRPVSAKSFVVCSAHFAPECIHNQRQFDVGVLSKLILKKGAIPTIRDPSESSETILHGVHYLAASD
ncbi:hypothetical protein INR49_002872, partial [Caranx melampygus]